MSDHTSAHREKTADSFEAILEAQRDFDELKPVGIGYSVSFNHHRPTPAILRMEPYAGVVRLERDSVTVRSGTLLADVAVYLDKHSLTLATLPEFMGLTAGACFFVEVHGSSVEYFSLKDLITAVTFLTDTGEQVTAQRGDANWNRLEASGDGLVLLEVTFKCIPTRYLSNELQWIDENDLEALVAEGHQSNLSTTIQWYPLFKQCLVYNINPCPKRPPRSTGAKALYRGSPYRLQRFLLRLKMGSKSTQYDRYHRILGPWRDLPLRKLLRRLERRNRQSVYDTEYRVPLAQAPTLLAALRQAIASGSLQANKRSSFGLRFSYRSDPATGDKTGYLWTEFVTGDRDQALAFIEAGRFASPDLQFHHGKFVP